MVSGPHLTQVPADDKVVVVLDVEAQVNAVDVVTQGLTFPQYPMVKCGTESNCIAVEPTSTFVAPRPGSSG